MYEKKHLGFLFALPFIIGILLFKIFPFGMSFFLSFTDYDPTAGLKVWQADLIGLRNYIEIFDFTNEESRYMSEKFYASYWVTVKFVFTTVPLRLFVALMVAQVLNFKLRGINFFRTAFYLPSVMGGSIAVSVLWKFLFSGGPDTVTGQGLVNIILGNIGISPIPWLASTTYAIWTIILLNAWQFGSAMVIFLAALQSVPGSLYEAASIDGASKWQMFFKVTVPLITPVIFFNMIMQSVNAFQEFNAPYMITKGGPDNATYLLSLFIFDESFRNMAMGFGSALSWVLFSSVCALSAVAFWSQKYWVFYSGEKRK